MDWEPAQRRRLEREERRQLRRFLPVLKKRTKTPGCIVDLKKKKRLLCQLRGGRFVVSRGNLSGGKGKNAGGRSVQTEESGKKQAQGSFKRRAAAALSWCAFSNAQRWQRLRVSVPALFERSFRQRLRALLLRFFQRKAFENKPETSSSRFCRFQKKKPPGRWVSAVKTRREADRALLSKKARRATGRSCGRREGEGGFFPVVRLETVPDFPKNRTEPEPQRDPGSAVSKRMGERFKLKGERLSRAPF